MAEAKIRLAVEGASLVRSELDRVNAGFDSLGSGATLLKSTLLGLVGGLSVGAFAGMIRGSIDAADSLNDLRKSTGLTIETLSGLKLASKQSGADLEGTAAAINKLSVNIGKNAEKFAALGVTSKDPLEAFKQLSDVFKGIDDPQLRAAVGAEALGKSWASAAPLLMEGGDEIQRMVDTGAALAGVNTDMAEAADAFNDKLAELTGTGGVMNSVTAALLPLLNLVADEFIDLHKNTAGANDGFNIISETFRSVVVLGANVAFVFKGVGREIGGVAAQLAAFGSGDYKGALAIGEMMKQDAAQARKDFDALEAKFLTAGKVAKNAYAGYTSGQNEPRAAGNNSAARAFVATGKSGGAEKISEYVRLQDALNKVIGLQDLELAMGGKLSAVDKFRADEVQKITAAYNNHKISQQERLKLMDLTVSAALKMQQIENRAAAVKANQFNYAEQIEFAKELADSEVSLSKAREDGRQILADYAQAIGADNEFTALQLSLVGQTEDAKERAIALYRIELELKKQIAAINANAGFDGGQRDEAIAAATATAASAKAGVTSKIQLREQEKYKQEQIDLWKQIDSTAEAVFMDIAKNGTSAFKNLEEELKNGLLKLLYEMTVKKWIISIGTEMGVPGLEGLLGGGGSGGGLFGKGVDFLSGLFGGGSAAAATGASATFGAVTGTAGTYGMSAAAGTGAAALAELSTGVATLGASAATAGTAATAGAASVGSMGSAILGAIPGIGWLALGATALFAIFGFGKDKIPTVLNDLSLFNNSLIGLPFLELSLSSDEAAQGLRDVLYGLDNATPTMRKLAGETINLSKELLVASGDIAGARNLARNLDTRGFSEEEIAVYDYNEKLRDQIQAHRDAAAAASAGASAAQAAKAAEDQLAQTRYNLAGKLNVLLGRTTQLEFDRATALAATTDASSIAMLTLTHQLEDMYSAVDANYAKLERSIAAEKKLVDVRLKSATDLAAALKTTKDAISPALDRSTAQSQIAMYLALAKAGGVLPSAAALKPALDAIAKPSTDLFATFEEYAIDQARTANDIGDLAGYADKQVSMEQQTLDRLDGTLELAKNQLDALKGIDNSVTSVAAAVAAFQLSMETLSAAKANASTFSFAAPTPSAASGGGGGGGYYGGGASGAAAGQYEAIAGQDNADIVAAYRTYYSRNPDASGYDYFAKSNLAGDALTQAILRASSGDVNGADYQRAIANGYDPMNPLAKYYKSKNKSSGAVTEDFGSFASGGDHAGGLRLVGELGPELEATGASRISSTNTLLDAFRSGGKNSDALVAEIKALRAEVQGLRTETRQVVTNTGTSTKLLVRVTNDGEAMSTVVAA